MLTTNSRRYFTRLLILCLISLAFYFAACEPDADDDTLRNGLILLFLNNSSSTSTGWTITVPDGVPL